MSTPPPTRKAPSKTPVEDRRAPESATGAAVKLSRLKGMLGRPLAVERRDGKLQVVLVERRRAPREKRTFTLKELCAELRSRLVVQEADAPTDVTRDLVLVHDVLAQKGWTGIEGLPPRLLAKAIGQAEHMLRDEPSRALATIVDRLRVAQVAAQIRRERGASDPVADSTVQVMEATPEEFAAVERVWSATETPPAETTTPSGREG